MSEGISAVLSLTGQPEVFGINVGIPAVMPWSWSPPPSVSFYWSGSTNTATEATFGWSGSTNNPGNCSSGAFATNSYIQINASNATFVSSSWVGVGVFFATASIPMRNFTTFSLLGSIVQDVGASNPVTVGLINYTRNPTQYLGFSVNTNDNTWKCGINGGTEIQTGIAVGHAGDPNSVLQKEWTMLHYAGSIDFFINRNFVGTIYDTLPTESAPSIMAITANVNGTTQIGRMNSVLIELR